MPITADKSRAVLREKSVLAALPDAALDALIRRGRNVTYAKGASIYQRDDPGDSLMIILSGRVKITNVTAEAREIVLNFLGEGDLNGELAALDGQVRSANATALEETQALVLFRRDLIPVLEQHPAAMLGVIAALTAKVRSMSAALEHAALQMTARAASGLLRLADQHGETVADGTRIALKVSQRDLGNFLGLSRENTSRQLGRLREDGYIRMDGLQIVIVDRDGLEGCAEAGLDGD